MHWQEEQEVGLRVHARLAAVGDLQPASDSATEAELFSDYDLASLVENRCGTLLDPSALDGASRPAWAARATTSPSDIGGKRDHDFLRPYWLMSQGRRIGTFALTTAAQRSWPGGGTMCVFSLYVLPPHRRAGHARRALQAANDAALAEGLSGLRLDTDWCWQRAVRFYCGIGMWIRMWKRDLDFTFCRDLPRWRVEIEGDRARFVVDRATGPRVLLRARREGERLGWEAPDASEDDASTEEMVWRAPGTFAVALALRGWPLLRSDEQWQAQLAQGFSDSGGPEGLAFRIQRYEAWAKKHGWRVDTPRIPGLDYPTWDELGG
jgi:GNAT superfamily N-acetyltransferase